MLFAYDLHFGLNLEFIMVGDVMALTNIIQNRVKEYALVLPSEDTKIFNRAVELEA